jgi:RNA polymerase sigma factor (sigma-70 family)
MCATLLGMQQLAVDVATEPVPGPLDESRLVAAIAAGDRHALAAVYDTHVRAVYRYALAALRDPEEAEDVTQEVFIVLLRKAKTVQLPGESVLPWLLVTCRNLARNQGRALARDSSSPLEDFDLPAVESAERQSERRALQEQIEDAVASLSDDDQILFWLCIENDLSYDAAAKTMQISHGAVRNRLSRLRRQLREYLTTEKASTSS